MDGKGGRRGRSFAWEVGSLFFFFHFLPAVLRLLVGHQGSLLRDGIKRMAGRDFGLVWFGRLGDTNIHIISYCAVVSYIGFTWLWIFVSFFAFLSGHLLSYLHLYLSIDQDHFCLNLERGSRALRGTGRTGIRARDGHRGVGLGSGLRADGDGEGLDEFRGHVGWSRAGVCVGI